MSLKILVECVKKNPGGIVDGFPNEIPKIILSRKSGEISPS